MYWAAVGAAKSHPERSRRRLERNNNMLTIVFCFIRRRCLFVSFAIASLFREMTPRCFPLFLLFYFLSHKKWLPQRSMAQAERKRLFVRRNFYYGSESRKIVGIRNLEQAVKKARALPKEPLKRF